MLPQNDKFQFAPPCGGRLAVFVLNIIKYAISIRAPAKGATAKKPKNSQNSLAFLLYKGICFASAKRKMPCTVALQKQNC